MKKLAALGCAALILGVTAAALAVTPASVAPTGTGITLIPSSDWSAVYPDVYETYMATSENSEFVDYVAEYPYIATLYEGIAFNTYYSSARGHYYTVEDVKETGRPHKLANCFTCKTADFTVMTLNEGDAAYSMAFEDAMASVNESVGCFSCHANDPAQGVTVTHTYLADAMGEDFASVDAKNLACAQCHVEYYFAPETKATSLPYKGLASMTPDEMFAFYEQMDFADYTNPRTGTKLIKVQHPEFETYMGAGSVHAGTFTCADCHMPTVTREDGTSFRSHQFVSPLESEPISQNCATCHNDLAGFVHGIQEKMEARTNETGRKLETLTNRLAEAVASGNYTEQELDAIRALNRKGQFYWDFVFVENSEGAHNSRLDTSCLDKADALADEALALFKL